MAGVGSIGGDLDRWLEPFLAALGHRKRRFWAPLYLRGLLGPSERKSLQPMATSLGLSGHDQLQHFIASPAWDDAPLWRVLAEQADRLVGGPEAVLVIDDTALPKKGTLSVGVARQYCGQLGKRANCQALVSLTLAGREVPVPVGLRLFLPEEWTRDAERCAAAGVPDAAAVARSKGEIALAELDRLIAAGLRFGLTLADAGYGASAAFRRGRRRPGGGSPPCQLLDLRIVPGAGHPIFVGNHLSDGILQQFLQHVSNHADDGAAQKGARHRHAFAHAGHDLDVQILRFLRKIGGSAHIHHCGRALHDKIIGRQHAVVEHGAARYVIKREPFAEHVAEIQGQTPRQGLQTEQAEQLADPRLDLEELAAVGLQLQVA